MKRNFLLFSMIAAALMTASCSKDDEKNPVEEQQIEQQTQVKQTRPIVIKAGKKSSVSKVATEDGYTLKFSQTDKLVLTDGTNTYAELNVDKIADDGTSATFKGEISTNADGQTIYAKIGSALDGVQTSTTSLADVVASNCYLKSEEFTYNANSEQFSVDLYDQNAYLVFNVAEGQKKVEITFGGTSTWYPVEGDITNQYLYVALPSGQAISGRFFGSKSANDVSAGKIYTINRTDVIDLGIENCNVLWKTTNETSGTATSYNQSDAATSVYKDEKYYTWSNARSFGYIDEDNNNNYVSGSGGLFRLPTKAELEALAGLANNTAFVTVNGMFCKEFSNDRGALFLPAVGYDGGEVVGDYGGYWSGAGDGAHAFSLDFYANFAGVSNNGDAGDKCSVRLVRAL